MKIMYKRRLVLMFLVLLFWLGDDVACATEVFESRLENVQETNRTLMGEGTQKNPYQITSAEDFPTTIGKDEYYCLQGNISLKEGQQIESLEGTLDGKGYVVTLANKPLANKVSGTIQNLGVNSVSAIQVSDYSGSVAIKLTGTIQNVYSLVSLTADDWFCNIGGLVGVLSDNAKVTNCYYAGTITGDYVTVGGIAAQGTISTACLLNCCYVNGNVAVAYGTGYQTNSSNYVKKSIDELKAGLANDILNTDLPDIRFYWAIPEASGTNSDYPVLVEGTLSADSVDKTALVNKIQEAEGYTEGDYTQESWSVLKEALNAAKEENRSEKSTKDTVKEALTKLTNAISALVKKKPTQAVALPEDEGEIVFISDAKELGRIADSKGKYYVLKNDITVSTMLNNMNAFSGVLDGQGHSIVYSGDNSSVLFQEIAPDGVIQNVHFTGKAGTYSYDGAACRTLKGSIINCYSDVTGDYACGFAKTLDGGQIVNSYSVSTGASGVLCKTYNSGSLIYTYWQEYLTNPVTFPAAALNNSYAMSEEEMKSLDFVNLLNENRGENGMKWGQSSSGYPYFGANQEYHPEDDTFVNQYEVQFTPYNSETAVTLTEQQLTLSPDAVNDFYLAGTFHLQGIAEDSRIIWSYSDSVPKDCVMTGTETGGELYVYKEGKACLTATEQKADGSSKQVAVIYVTVSAKTMESIQLWIDGVDVTNGSCQVEGSEWKSIQVKAKYTDSEDYVPVAYTRFTYTSSDAEMVYNISGSRSFYFKKPGTATMTVSSIVNPAIKATVDITSHYVPVEAVEQTIADTIELHGRNANSSAKNGLSYLPDYSGVVVTPENASYRDAWTITSSNPEVAEYVVSMVHGYVPYKEGITTYTVAIEDINEENEKKVVSSKKQVQYLYKNPLLNVTADKQKIEVANYSETLLHLNYTGEVTGDGYGITEPGLVWTYDKENIVKIERKKNGDFVRDEEAADNGYYLAGTDYYIHALSEGTVTATGRPVDTTNEVAPVVISITVTPTKADAPDIDTMVSKGTAGAISYLETEYSENYMYGYEWILYTLLRADGEVSQAQKTSYYNSAVAEIKTWDGTEKPTDIERVALALSILGKDITDVEGMNLAAMIYNHSKLTDGSNELVYALLALDAKQTIIPVDAKWSREKIITALLSFQNIDGGFGLTDNKSASVDMTAMALQALAPYKENTKVSASIKAALSYLKGQQSADCGFHSAESTAQVWIALSALGMDALDASIGFGNSHNNVITNLNQYYVEKPSGYVHTIGKTIPDSMATIQVLQAFTAYEKLKNGEGSYWDLTEVKNDTTVKLTLIAFEKNSYTLYATEKLQLKAICSEQTDKVEKYKSENESIATISQNGVLTGVKAGSTKITVTAESGATATVNVKVKMPTVKLSTTKGKLQVKKSTTALKVKEKLTTDKVVKWTSSNKKVVSVSKKGKLTAKKIGKATITVTMKSGATAKCQVTVQKSKVKSTIRFKKKNYTLRVKDTLKTGCKLSNALDEIKSYKTSNKKVVTVSKKGVLKGVKTGTAKVTVTTKNGAKATVKVVVKKKK